VSEFAIAIMMSQKQLVAFDASSYSLIGGMR